MSHRTDSDRRVDHELRRALETDVDAAERITRAALAAEGQPTGHRAGAWSLATGLVIGSLVLALWLRPPAATDHAEPTTTTGTLITNHGEVVALRDPAGRIRLLRDSTEPPGSGPRLVIIKGDSDG